MTGLRGEPHLPLSDREMQVARMVGWGLSTSEIAGRLGIAYETVRNHRATVLRKLGVENSIEMLSALGWLTVPSEEPAV